MIVNKWNFSKHIYEIAEIDDECCLFENNFNKTVKCANCNRNIKAGDSYTSLQYHNNNGLGYMVCSKCYNNEWRKKELWKK